MILLRHLMYLFRGLTRRGKMRSRYPAIVKKNGLKRECSPGSGNGWDHVYLGGSMGMSCRHWISTFLEPSQASSPNLL